MLEINNKSSKIQSVEYLRGIAALMVCVFHIACGNANFLHPNSYLKQMASFGYLGVELFFVISGFIIPFSLYKSKYTLSKFKSFLLRRLTRIEPPYIASIILVLLLNYLASKTSGFAGESFNFDIKQFFAHFGYLTEWFGYNWYQDIYWTLLIEFQFYILIGIVFTLLVRSKLLSITTLILLMVSHFIIPLKLFHFIGLFTIGMSYFLYKIDIINKRDMILLSIILCIFNMFTVGISEGIAGLFAIAFMEFAVFDNKLLKFLGTISFSLYLIHCPIGGKIINLSLRFSNNIITKYAIFNLALVISLIIAYLFYFLIEKKAIAYSKINFNEAS